MKILLYIMIFFKKKYLFIYIYLDYTPNWN